MVKREGFVKVKKYDRYKRTTSRIPAHNPPCINARVGDKVRIMECRKLSKTVSFVVTNIIGKDEETPKESPKVTKKTVKKKPKKPREAENG